MTCAWPRPHFASITTRCGGHQRPSWSKLASPRMVSGMARIGVPFGGLLFLFTLMEQIVNTLGGAAKLGAANNWCSQVVNIPFVLHLLLHLMLDLLPNYRVTPL